MMEGYCILESKTETFFYFVAAAASRTAAGLFFYFLLINVLVWLSMPTGIPFPTVTRRTTRWAS